MLVVLFVGAVAGCGGGAAPAKAPASSGVPAEQSDAEEERPGNATPQRAAPPVRAGGGASGDATARQRARARAELDQAERELEASSSDCASACRALGSMERAARHLCDLSASSSEDVPRCDEAQRKLRSARERVRTTCGTCPGGPSLDPPR